MNRLKCRIGTSKKTITTNYGELKGSSKRQYRKIMKWNCKRDTECKMMNLTNILFCIWHPELSMYYMLPFI